MADTKLNEHLVGKVWTRDRAQRGSDSIYTSSSLEAAPGRGGTETLAFRPDGTFSMSGPGADDRPQALTGTWKLDDAADHRVILDFDNRDTKATLRLTDQGDIAVKADEK
jgi:hypothetical protein